MAEELTTGTEIAGGQAGEGLGGESQITGAAPEGEGGQPGGTIDPQTTGNGTVADGEETFFDPRDIEGKPELEAAYKQMQRAFTKKMEGIKGSKQKQEAYDAFMANPLHEMGQIAARMGYKISPVGQAEAQKAQDPDWEPQTWEDVFQKAEERAYARLKTEISPLFSELQGLKKNNIEQFLDTNCGDWRVYEDAMMKNLKEHPTLVKNPAALYAMSVPPEVLESRATQRALKKMQEKAESGKVSKGSSTTRKPSEGMPTESLSFGDAVKFAEKKLQEEGLRRP